MPRRSPASEPSPTARPRPGSRPAAGLTAARRRAQRRLTHRLTARIAANLDLDSILDQLVDDSMAAFGADRALVSLLGPRGFEVVVARGLSDAWIEATRVLPEASLGRAAFGGHRALASVHYAHDPRGAGMREAVLAEGFDSLAVAPLMAADAVVGFLALYHDRPRPYDEEELDVLLGVADYAAIAIRHARDYGQLATWTAQLQAIQALGARLGGLRTVAEIGQAIVSELSAVIACHGIRVYRTRGEVVVPVAMLGEGAYLDETADELTVRLGHGITGWVAEHGTAEYLPDAARDPRGERIPGTADIDESMLLAPMVYDGRVLGVLVLSRLGLDQFVADDLRLLAIFASFAAGAMANADAADRRMRESEGRLRAILESIADAVVTIDDEGRIVAVNRAAEVMFGAEAGALVGQELGILVPARQRRRHRVALRRHARAPGGMDGRTIEVAGRRLSGEEFPAEVSFSSWTLDGRRFATVMVREITERQRVQAALRASEAKYRELVEHVPAIVYTAGAGPAGVWTYVSPRVEQLLGFPADAWTSDPGFWLSRVHPDDRERVIAEEEESWWAPRGYRVAVEYRLVDRNGGIRWVSDDAVVVHPEDGSSPHWSGFLTDITQRKALEAQLQHQAFHDPLTGLANRALFADRVEHALTRADRRRDSLAVLFLDLDDFKTINDGMGHAAGDALLVAVADAIRSCLRPMDTAARLGGDEFAVLVEDLADPQAALDVAARIQAAVRRPFAVLGREIVTSASMGIARPAGRRDRAAQLLRNADSAMYAAKRQGKGRFEVFAPRMHAAALHRLELVGEIRRALERGELELHYQPTVRLTDGAVVGLEALARWNHPSRGLVLPAEFIPTAEETGQIIPLGRIVLLEACRQARAWQAGHAGSTGLTMSVNVSARQFRDPALGRDVESAVSEAGLDPSLLVLEITESVVMEDSRQAFRRLQELKALGVRLAIDDFGTGYSSLAYLRRLPVDVLKLDKSFIDGIVDGSDALALAGAIVRMGKTLRLCTVAEGVELPSQAAALRRIGCDLAQGFFFARPLPAADVTALLAGSATAQRLAG